MRLIDADKVKIDSRKHCVDCKINGTEHCKTCVINLICDRMDLQPTIEERREGKWIDYSDTDGYIECSFCHVTTVCRDNIGEFHYCWNCGAKMKGGAE